MIYDQKYENGSSGRQNWWDKLSQFIFFCKFMFLLWTDSGIDLSVSCSHFQQAGGNFPHPFEFYKAAQNFLAQGTYNHNFFSQDISVSYPNLSSIFLSFIWILSLLFI